jgi:hypothetical protein
MVRRFGYVGIALVAASGCATRTGDPGTIVVKEPLDPVLAELRGRLESLGEGAVRDSVAAPPDRVHAAFVTAFRELGIPTDVVNPTTRQVANPQFRVGRELGGVRLGRLLRCGETMTGPRAESDRVIMAVVSDVRPLGKDASAVETRVIAVATDTGGTRRRAACSSTGELEQRLHDVVKKAAAAGPGA